MTATAKLWVSLQAGGGISISDALSYTIFSGTLWVFFYVLLERRAASRKIVPRRATRVQIGCEIVYSLRSIVIFGVVGAVVVYAACAGRTRLYAKVDDYGWGWFAVSIVVSAMRSFHAGFSAVGSDDS